MRSPKTNSTTQLKAFKTYLCAEIQGESSISTFLLDLALEGFRHADHDERNIVKITLPQYQ
jgi:hypothetical protein